MGLAYHYSRWDGTQRVFEIDEEELMNQLAEDLLAHGSVHRSLRDLLQRGFQNRWGEQMPGIHQLRERLRAERQRHLEQYDLDSLMRDLKERLHRAVQTERQGIQRRLEEAQAQVEESQGPQREQRERLMELLRQRADQHRQALDALPPSVGGAIRQLQDYEFMDPEAQRQFQELMDLLRQQMMQQVAQDLKSGIQGLKPEQMAAIREMLRELNQMMRDRMEGREPDFQGFMEQWGPMFGPNPPESVDQLMEQLQQQMAQMQSLLESMSPEQRQELLNAMDSVLDSQTAQELAQLAMAMEQMYPLDDLRRQYPFMGEEDLTLEKAMELMGQLQSMDQLEQQIKEVAQRGNIEALDPVKVEELLGEEARRDLERLQEIAKRLEEAGYLKRKGERLELTPRGIRKIAQRALRDLFGQLKKDRMGQHQVHRRGAGGEHEGETKLYEFGDPFDVNLEKTVMNALTRSGTGVPVRLDMADFEVYRSEHATQAATVLLLDQSRSMGLFGSFAAAKKVAMALYALIHSQFPRDKLYIVGFSDYAVELKGEELPEVTWNAWVSGTNIHHALILSRKLLARDKGGTRQVIMITDGEPTAHLEGNRPFFSYPPSYQTLQETLKEVKRCTQEGITINTFMLETSYYLLDFVDRMTRINKGRAFYTTPDKLGQYVLVDYMTNRRKRVA